MVEFRTLKKNQIYYVGSHKRKFKGTFTITTPLKYSPEKLNTIYKASKYLFPLLNRYKFDYFAIGGTLLGAVRHQGIIPWDYDIDIAISKKTYFRIINLLDELNAINSEFYWVDVRSPGIRIYYQNCALIDLFTVDVIDKKYLAYSGRYSKDKTPTFEVHHYCFPKIKPLIKETYPLKWIQFEDLKIRAPKNPKHFLSLNYNNKCLKEVKGLSNNHSVIHSGIFDSKKIIPVQRWFLLKGCRIFPNVHKLVLKKLSKKFGVVFKDYGVKKKKKKKKIRINYFKLLYEIPAFIIIGVSKLGIINSIKALTQ